MHCKHCSQPFILSTEEESFIEAISPVIKGKKYLLNKPTLCPKCRIVRRVSFRNERFLYHRKCDLSGREIISNFSQDKPYKIYDQKEWWSDKWDPLDYGRDFDFTRPFFAQYDELLKAVPLQSMLTASNENSEYTNCVSHLKNCYLLFSSDYSQDCYYGSWIEASKDCIDILNLDQCERVYEAVFSQICNNCKFIINCSNCSDSAFLFDCKGCNNCFMSSGLRNKQYYIENKPFSPEEFKEKMRNIDLGSRTKLTQLKQRFAELAMRTPRLYMYRNGRLDNSTGNALTDCENCFECFDSLRGKDCMYVEQAFDIKNIQHSSCIMGEFGYENCECVPNPYHSGFNLNTYSGSNLWYCTMCMNNCNNCFGCVSLRHKEYCILNKQYNKEQYEELLPRIIEHMKNPGLDQGEWGEFFPTSISPFAYNETTAYDHFPITKEKVASMGAKWKEDEVNSRYYGEQTNLPDNISETSDEHIQKIFTCIGCSRQYRIIQQELRFYHDMKIALPQQCFDCRHRERLNWKNGWNLWDRECHRCHIPIRSTYSPQRPETVYCEKCYQTAVLT